MTGGSPGTVYLAGARTVEGLAMERHRKYQADRGREASLNSWAPKVSRALLEAMDAQDAWALLDDPAPATNPPVTDALRRPCASRCSATTGSLVSGSRPGRR